MTPKNLLIDVTQKPEKKQIYKIKQKNINKLIMRFSYHELRKCIKD